MIRPRHLVFRVALAALVVLGAAACEKPLPGATAWSGTVSEHVEPVCWAREGTIVAAECAAAEGDLARIPIQAGRVFGISVDPAIAEGGWVPFLDGRAMTAAPVTATYWKLPFPAESALTGATLRVLALNEEGQGRAVYAWSLVPQGRFLQER